MTNLPWLDILADFAATTDTPTFALVSLERHRAEVEGRGQR